MSIPAGFLVERFGEKTAMIAAFLVGTAGSLSFALHPGYRLAVFSLFVMGSGMATLQTAINPLLRVSVGEAHFAFNSAFAQLVFGSASFLSPYMYSYLVLNLGNEHARQRLAAQGAVQAHASGASMGFRMLDFLYIYLGHDCSPFLQPLSPGGAYRRRAGRLLEDL